VSLSLIEIVVPPVPETSEISGAVTGMGALVCTTVLGLRTSPAFDEEAPSSYVTAALTSFAVPLHTSVPEK
jgi:hypothetical protein